MPLPPRESWSGWTVLRTASVIAIAIVWTTVSAELGIRFLGLLLVAHAAVHLVQRKIPYGWRGHEASGHFTGLSAVVLGLAMAIGGIYLLIAPQLVAGVLGSNQ